LTDKRFVERASTALLLGILRSSLAVCVLGALSYDIAYWFGASWAGACACARCMFSCLAARRRPLYRPY